MTQHHPNLGTSGLVFTQHFASGEHCCGSLCGAECHLQSEGAYAHQMSGHCLASRARDPV